MYPYYTRKKDLIIDGRIFVHGQILRSRISEIVAGKELEENNKRLQQAGLPINTTPFTDITLTNTDIIAASNKEKDQVLAKFSTERLWDSRRDQTKRNYSIINRWEETPKIFTVDEDTTRLQQKDPEEEPAQRSRALIEVTFKDKMISKRYFEPHMKIESVVIDIPDDATIESIIELLKK